MAPFTLPAEFGYVGLVVAATYFMNFWHMMRIGSLRKKYKIQYPAMTSDKHEDFMYAQVWGSFLFKVSEICALGPELRLLN